MPQRDSLQGSLDLMVLKILSRRGKLHGYAIMTAIQEMSAEVLRVEALLLDDLSRLHLYFPHR